LCEAFARSGIPFKTSSHRPLAQEPAVRGILRELDAATGDAALSVELAAAAARAKFHGTEPGDATIDLLAQRLAAIAATCGHDRARFLDAVALATEADFFDPRADRVSLLTLHAAKGLEFPVVFIVGLEDGLLPLRWGEPDDAAMAEERRLFYVGMTRAKDRLILSRARERFWRGRVRALDPSPFLGDIETALVQHQQMQAKRRRAEDRQLKLF
jgi:DNA helicase-2/ATP-dependent DNA helicase PcrA